MKAYFKVDAAIRDKINNPFMFTNICYYVMRYIRKQSNFNNITSSYVTFSHLRPKLQTVVHN